MADFHGRPHMAFIFSSLESVILPRLPTVTSVLPHPHPHPHPSVKNRRWVRSFTIKKSQNHRLNLRAWQLPPVVAMAGPKYKQGVPAPSCFSKFKKYLLIFLNLIQTHTHIYILYISLLQKAIFDPTPNCNLVDQEDKAFNSEHKKKKEKDNCQLIVSLFWYQMPNPDFYTISIVALVLNCKK